MSLQVLSPSNTDRLVSSRGGYLQSSDPLLFCIILSYHVFAPLQNSSPGNLLYASGYVGHVEKNLLKQRAYIRSSRPPAGK